MGDSAVGTLLNYSEVRRVSPKIQSYGIEQILSLWRKTKDRDGDVLLWGDETEGSLVSFNDKQRQFKPCLRAAEVVRQLTKDVESAHSNKSASPPPSFQLEVASFNVETTPGKPWGVSSEDLLEVEANMRWRRNLIQGRLKSDEFYMTLSYFPRLGQKEGSGASYSQQRGEIQRSQYLSDELIGAHPRYQALASSIFLRRGRKVAINVPIFQDKHSPRPFHDPTVNYNLHDWAEDDDVRNGAVKENHIYGDCFTIGSSTSLQVTVQGKNIDEARKLYDQLIPLGPIMLALTAATPFFKGYLTDVDTRWPQVEASMEDRTPAELGEKPPAINEYGFIRPRWSSNSTYISLSSSLRPAYQDPHLVVNEPHKNHLMTGGMDTLLATHFAHLFIRDPLVVYTKDLDSFDPTATNLFDSLQTTNWNTVRFKPPASQSPTERMGWRVEFRAMDVQVSDFENAAFAVTIILLTRTILAYNLNLYIPIIKVDENMERANQRNAVVNQSFHFRKSIFSAATSGLVEDEYHLMTINEIMNGSPPSTNTSSPSIDGFSSPTDDFSSVNSSSSSSDNASSTNSSSSSINGLSPDGGAFPGLLPLVRRYLTTLSLTPAAYAKIDSYLSLVSKRASGELWTAARWQREFVRGHSEYKWDSVLSEGVAFDLLKRVREIAEAGGEGLLGGW